MLSNHRFLQALRRQPVDKTPIWIMRQAGRYLPEYRKLREQAKTFLNLCKTPELACEISLQPIQRFPLDAAIIFSDILTIPDAMGLGLHFVENEGPKFTHPIRSISDIEKLPIPDMNELSYVMDAIALTSRTLNNRVPLLGFSGSPWTLATYMLEGGASKTFSTSKKWLFAEPNSLHMLLEKLAVTVSHYLDAQIQAGAQAVMLFDTWGGILTPQDYQIFSLNYMQRIIMHLKKKHAATVPIILFTKNGGQWLETMAESGADALGLDWTTKIADARRRVGNKVALQGNMDPAVLYASPARVQAEAHTILTDYGNQPGHIFNLGHGINPDTPIESVAALVEAVHNHALSKAAG
jgi:uroporphyrinogen decarboxylase